MKFEIGEIVHVYVNYFSTKYLLTAVVIQLEPTVPSVNVTLRNKRNEKRTSRPDSMAEVTPQNSSKQTKSIKNAYKTLSQCYENPDSTQALL